MMRLGLGDVTENCTNARTDFAAARRMGATWGFVRATTTGVWVAGKPSLKLDKRFYENVTAMRDAGIEPWAYCWFDPRVKYIPAFDQAVFFIEAVEGLGIYKYSLDVENSSNVAVYSAASVAGAREWLRIVTDETEVTPGIYTYPAFVDSLARMADISWMVDYPLDVAQWNVAAPVSPFPWWPSGWRSWQYRANAPGVSYGFNNSDPKKGAYQICLSVIPT